MLSARLSQPTIFAPGTSSLSICATRASTPSSALRLRFIWLRLRFRGARRGTRAGSVSSSQQALWRAWGFSKEKAATSGLFFHRSVRQAWEHVFRSARKWAARACGERRCPSPVRACLEVVDLSHMYQLAEASPTAPVPPQNLDAEESVLGAMILSPGAIGAVSEVLSASDWANACSICRPRHHRHSDTRIALARC
jgi:hypothetical protein